MSIKLAIGSDHAGFELKEQIIAYLKEQKINFIDKGCYSNERVDYPDFGHAVALSILNNEVNLGIIICGSGNGINMAANKHKGIRAALCWNEEIAKLAKQHNNANILTLPGRFITLNEALKCVKAFLNETFEGGRHTDRINKIDC
ncbi:MAG: ribose 5-phosphate isomerase B [Bacteroidetes bacterium]|nr:ribose 5-phosphate isomerase B [Bacteroidota bacterium]